MKFIFSLIVLFLVFNFSYAQSNNNTTESSFDTSIASDTGTNKQDTSTTTQTVPGPKKNVINQARGYSNVFITILFTVILLSQYLILIIFFRKQKELDRIVHSKFEEYQTLKEPKEDNSKMLNDIESKNLHNERQILEHSNKISELNEAIQHLQELMSKIETEYNLSSQNQILARSKVTELSNITLANLFYMAAPAGNYFLNANKVEKKDAGSLYKFIVSPNSSEAEFEIDLSGIDTENIKGLMMQRQDYIKPACDEENTPSANSTTIITKTKGRVLLQDGKWIIKEKALVRYE
jgi:hypothetical protein